MKEQNTKILATITIVLALALTTGLIVVPAIEQYQQADAAKSVTGQCASSIKNASAPLCPKP